MPARETAAGQSRRSLFRPAATVRQTPLAVGNSHAAAADRTCDRDSEHTADPARERHRLSCPSPHSESDPTGPAHPDCCTRKSSVAKNPWPPGRQSFPETARHPPAVPAQIDHTACPDSANQSHSLGSAMHPVDIRQRGIRLSLRIGPHPATAAPSAHRKHRCAAIGPPDAPMHPDAHPPQTRESAAAWVATPSDRK